jgi:hypothetical protein
MEKNIKIVLGILMFGCLLDMPYGYYQFVRFTALIGFVVLAYQANQKKKQTETIVYGVLALLFQPFFKVSLGRDIWNVLDVILGIGLLLSLFKKKKNE